jgi:type II secretory pathway pseudopilin PulG
VAAALFPPYTLDMRRPGVVTVIAILDLIFGTLALLAAALVVVAGFSGRSADGPLVMVLMGGMYGVFGLMGVAAGVGMLQMRSWGRILQIVMACFGVLALGCGTIVSILILVYLFKPGVKVLFSGRTAEELTPQEAADVAQLKAGGGTSPVVIVLVVFVLLLVAVAIIGIIAAIAIPSLLRARIAANEAGAIGNVRTVISAEAAYQSASGGYYDVPACLYAPAPCLGASAPATPFLSQESTVFDAPKMGYVLRFHPGRAATASGGATVSSSGIESFAVVAEPVGPQTGVRTFCADASGIICIMSAGEHQAPGGTCPQSCAPIR